MVNDNYKKLFFEIFKIKQPYSIKIDYIKEELLEIKNSNMPNEDKLKAIDESVPNKIDEILVFLEKINNNLIIETDNYKTFFELINSRHELENKFNLTFQTIDGKDIKLSAGEKTILFYLERIDFMLSKLGSKSNILLFDEIELYLHPNWQKRILKIILNFIQRNELEKNLHIIVASHSPFILSDLPKENIIFLEKGKQVYPFDDGKQTFGANIHTLLSHGFFMKDGLMGEFAKDKIDLAITYLNQKTLTQEELDYCENIISIIGEPIIKRELQRKLDSKKLSKLDKIDEIEEQMKLLAHRLELIRKNQK